MGAAGEPQLDLQAAADALGVHYQTAYRWVRTGRLKAEVVGGRYVVARDDLDAVATARTVPRNPPAPRAIRLDRSADRMHRALVDGDEVAAATIARKLVAEGAAVTDLIQRVFVPSLRRIGQAWHDGKLTIWVEHRASAIVERLLGELAPNPRGRRRGTVMVAAVSGDLHSLPTSMAAVALRDDNWHVQHLGADMPAEELVRFCDEHDVDVAVLTVTNTAASALAAKTAQRLRDGGTPTIVGGPGQTLEDLIDLAREATSSGTRRR